MNTKNKHKIVRLTVAVVVLVAAVAAAGWFMYQRVAQTRYAGNDEVRLYLPAALSGQALTDTLTRHLGGDFAGRVMQLWRLSDSDPAAAHGSYVVKPGMTAKAVARKLRTGAQDPVKVTFNNVRTLDQLADRISRKMDFGADAFIAACDTVLSARGYTPETYPAAFFPDTYEFYWSAPASAVVTKLADYHDRWWTPERRAKAESLGLDPVQVATLASIVEEETAKADERPIVARLYLNRLDRGMLLQADPTVKFAYGDFSLRRITAQHLKTESPYNTYLHAGLPPGPIRIVEPSTLEAVLDAPEHNYIYMCAKEDFSGYHNFAVTGAEHAANARRYHAELNRRNIK